MRTKLKELKDNELVLLTLSVILSKVLEAPGVATFQGDLNILREIEERVSTRVM